MATTVTSDAGFKTYVEGLTTFATDTVYMNDDSKYWTFTRENNGKINAICVTANDVELWIYDGTNWIINSSSSVIDNLNSTSTTSALSANQGRVLNEAIQNITVPVALTQGINLFPVAFAIGYITGSGNYIDFFIPVCIPNELTVTAVTCSTNSRCFLNGSPIQVGSSLSIASQNALGIACEYNLPSTQTANNSVTVYLVNLSITCSSSQG